MQNFPLAKLGLTQPLSSSPRYLSRHLLVKGHQSHVALGPQPQMLVPVDGARHKQGVVGNRPEQVALRLRLLRRRRRSLAVVVVAVLVRIALHTAPEPRQAHAVTKAVHNTDGQQATRTQVQERRIAAKECRVRKLDQRPQHNVGLGHTRVRH